MSINKLAIDVGEKGHTDRYIDYDIGRQKAIEKELGCKFIRINPNAETYDIFIEIGRIHNHIIELTKEKTKKSLIDNVSKILLELEFKSNHLIKSKCLKRIVKKIMPSL